VRGRIILICLGEDLEGKRYGCGKQIDQCGWGRILRESSDDGRRLRHI
jgi:hypothetical protein